LKAAGSTSVSVGLTVLAEPLAALGLDGVCGGDDANRDGTVFRDAGGRSIVLQWNFGILHLHLLVDRIQGNAVAHLCKLRKDKGRRATKCKTTAASWVTDSVFGGGE